MPPIKRKNKSPTIHLAHVPGAQGDNVLLGRNGVPQLPKALRPALLVSYFYIDKFLDQQHKYAYRDWVLDSGAFSAYNLGRPINLYAYTEFCLRIKESERYDPPVEIIALDQIATGATRAAKKESGRVSLKNAECMRDNGLTVIPVFHIGEDWEILKEYARGWDKVGLSCRFGEPASASMKFYEQCFARVWPKKCHSFGWVGEEMLLRFPFHSSDSSDWEIKPAKFGTWRCFGGQGSTAYMNWKGSNQNLRAEVEWYLRLEARLRDKWKQEMLLLEALPKEAPTVRLVASRDGGGVQRLETAFKRK